MALHMNVHGSFDQAELCGMCRTRSRAAGSDNHAAAALQDGNYVLQMRKSFSEPSGIFNRDDTLAVLGHTAVEAVRMQVVLVRQHLPIRLHAGAHAEIVVAHVFDSVSAGHLRLQEAVQRLAVLYNGARVSVGRYESQRWRVGLLAHGL